MVGMGWQALANVATLLRMGHLAASNAIETVLARIWSATLFGIHAVKVGVEVDVAGGLPKVVVVGLPDTAVQESRERVKAALKILGLPFPCVKLW